MQFSGAVELTTSHQRPSVEDPAVRAMFALRQASNLEQEVANHLQAPRNTEALLVFVWETLRLLLFIYTLFCFLKGYFFLLFFLKNKGILTVLAVFGS